jgi:hypothetical protein
MKGSEIIDLIQGNRVWQFFGNSIKVEKYDNLDTSSP